MRQAQHLSSSYYSFTSVIGKALHLFLCAQSFYLCISCSVQNLYVIMLNPILVYQDQKVSITSPYCIFEAILKVTFDLSSIIWTSLIIFSVYASVVHKYSLQSKEYVYLIIAYVVPLIAAVIPAFFQQYGYNTYFCWFDSHNQTNQLYFKLGYYFIPLWLFFIINVVLSQRTYRKLKKIGIAERDLSIFKRLMLFPFILFLTGIFATIDIFYIYFTGNFIIWLDFLGLFFISLYGFFTSIAYGFNPIIRDKIEELCCKKKETVSQNNSGEHQNMDEFSGRSTYSSRNTEKLEAQLFSVRTRNIIE